MKLNASDSLIVGDLLDFLSTLPKNATIKIWDTEDFRLYSSGFSFTYEKENNELIIE